MCFRIYGLNRDKEMIMGLCWTMVRPHLEYGIKTWNLFLKKDVENLEIVQRRGTKIIIKGSQRLSHDERLKHCGLTALE